MSGRYKKDKLDLSVLIATRDRSKLLEATLDHFRYQDLLDVRWEVIVVDNGSVDETPSVLRRAREHLPLVALHEQRPGKNCALNRALDVAQGDLLVFTDDDVIPETRWLNEIFAASRRWPHHSIFAGRIIPKVPSDTPAWLRHHRFVSAAFCPFSPPQDEGPLSRTPFGANFAVRTRALAGLRFSERAGPQGKSYAMGGETELLQRLQARGEGIIYVPSAIVKHVVQDHQINLRWLLKRSFHLGRGMVRLGRDHSGNSVYLYGAPRYLWRMVGSAWIQYALAMFRDETVRFDAGTQLHYLRGCIHEHRILTRERSYRATGYDL